MLILTALQLLGGLASIRAAEFNTTVDFELGIWSTVLDFTHGHGNFDPLGGGWRYNETTETFDKWNLSDTTIMELTLVGAGYRVNGDLQANPSVNGSTSVALISHAIRQGDVDLQTSVSGAEPIKVNGIPQIDLGGMNRLQLNSYSSDVTFHNNVVAKVRSLNVTLPVRTQAEKLEDMQTTFSTVRNPYMTEGQVSPGYAFRPMQRHSYFDLPLPEPISTNYRPRDYGIDTIGWTEVTYRVPVNTTLVHLVHDVGPNRSCYVYSEPSPPWFSEEASAMPTVESTKLFNRTNQTMQLLPLDPEVEYQLVFGPWNENTTCSLTGVNSYSFYANGNGPPNSSTTSVPIVAGAASSAAGAGRKADDVASPSPSPSSVHSKGVNVGAIVGGVVGGVGGAALLILSGCLLIRRRRRKHEPVPDSDDDLEDMMSPGEEPHVITQYMLQPSTGTPALSGKEAASMTHAEAPTVPPLDSQMSNHGVQYAQDAEDVDPEDSGPTILPPRYKEAWGQRLVRSAPRRVNQILKGDDPTSPIRAHDGVNKP